MTKRIKKTIAAVAALGALALGGAVFAQAQSGQSASAPSVQSASESVTAPDTDNIQSGDQTTPDQAGTASSGASESVTALDTDNIQSGDQTTPDQAGTASGAEGQSAESPEQPGAESPEQPGAESAPESDGPGGHADEPGNPNANNEFQGEQ
jgi:cytoskeletal protein RodZ